MEDDDFFDPLHLDLPEATINKFRTVPRTFLLSSEAFKAYTGLKSRGFPIDERIFDAMNQLILSYEYKIEKIS